MPELTYIDRELQRHRLTVLRAADLPGFFICQSDLAGRVTLNRTDIHIDGVPTTKDREHLLVQLQYEC